MKKTLFVVVGIIIVVFVLWLIGRNRSESIDQQFIATPTQEALFACADGKTVLAGFSDRLVSIELSDGRSYTLEETSVVDDEARYANEGSEIVFFTKGLSASVEENGTTTYADCIAAAEE